jgi:hypothetical protein
MGITLLRKLQLGREVTPGTAVAATTLWRGVAGLEDKREVVMPKEYVGYLSGIDRTYIPKLQSEVAFDDTEATFEQILHILEAGIATVTPAADGVGTDFIYTYPFPTTSIPTIKTYTIEGGDNVQEEEIEYCFVQEFKLSGNAGEAWMLSSQWVGRQNTPSTFTPAIAIPTVEDMLFSKTKLYIEAISGVWGTTQKLATLIGASLTYKTGLMAVYTADGQLYFTFHKITQPEVELELTMEYDATAIAEITNWRNQTPRLIELKTEGSAFATPGTLYTYKTMKIDLAGKWASFDPPDDKDGNSVVTGKFIGKYDPTGAKFGQIIVAVELAAVP